MASFLEKTEKTSKKLEQSPDINRLFNGMVIQQQRLNSSLRSSKVSSLLGQYAENRSFKGVTPEINKDGTYVLIVKGNDSGKAIKKKVSVENSKN